MSKVLNRNLKVGLSNQVLWELEKLSSHDVSKNEAHKNIMENIKAALLKIDVEIEKESDE